MDVCSRLVHAATMRRQCLKRLNVGLDLQDAKLALAYGPQRDGRCAWAPAHALLSTVLEAMVENTQVGCQIPDNRWPQRQACNYPPCCLPAQHSWNPGNLRCRCRRPWRCSERRTSSRRRTRRMPWSVSCAGYRQHTPKHSRYLQAAVCGAFDLCDVLCGRPKFATPSDLCWDFAVWRCTQSREAAGWRS